MKIASKPQEALRSAVGLWPFSRGTIRIPKVLGALLPNLHREGVVARAGAGPIRFPYAPGDVAHPAYWFMYEPNVRKAIRKHLSPGDAFIDIGAHRGFHSSFALSRVGAEGLVISCEPHPDHVRSLRELGRLNPAFSLYVENIAVSRESGTGTLLTSPHEGWHTLMPDFNEASRDPTRSTERVDTYTLDDLWEKYRSILSSKPRTVIAKIDAEGSELDILEGGQVTLRKDAMSIIILECTGGSGPWRRRASTCVALLKDFGWDVSVLDRKRVRPWHTDDAGKQVDLFCARR